VLDPRIVERLAGGTVSMAGVERLGVALRRQHHAAHALLSRRRLGHLEDLRADTTPPLASRDGHPAEPGHAALDQHAARPDDGLATQRHDMEGLVVTAVELLWLRHALLAAEDGGAKRERRLELGASAYPADR
jgi:hypothetical protein